MLITIKKSYETGDWDSYRVNAHGVKSAAKSIGAVEISDMAKALEYAVKDSDFEYIKNNHEEFITKYNELIYKLKNRS